MDWTNIISLILSGGVLGGLGGIFYFRPRLKEAKAGADKAHTEAARERNEYLLGRIESMERLYKQQGDMLDEVRQQVLELKDKAMDRESVISDLKEENRMLTDKVEDLKAENAALSERVESLKVENASLSEKVASLVEEIRSRKKK